jgi:MFS transporter, SP family, solute carrier family 2 (myo-inositol transporter), member 13
MATVTAPATDSSRRNYNRFLLLVAGLGGLLYGVDVGIIAGALPYLQATSGLNAQQLSFIVAARPCSPERWPTGWGANR